MTRTDDLEQLVVGGHALARIAAQTSRNDAPAAQWRALSILRTEGPRRIGELAIACRTTQPGMTKLIGQLEESELIQRSSDPHDSRATVVRVLPAGERALDAWRVQLRDALNPLLDRKSTRLNSSHPV